MFTRIKDWWYAILVCRKYGIRWNPFRSLGNASFRVTWNGARELTYKKIHMSPFYPNFLGTFMHEVGHLILYKQGTAINLYVEGKKKILLDSDVLVYKNQCFLNLLVEESLASRFSRKATKQRADVKDLVTAFNAYTSHGYSRLVKNPISIDKLTDTVYTCTKRIEK